MGRISMPQGRGSLKHNIRDYTEEEKVLHENINFNKTSQNIVFVHKNVKDAYEEIFGDYVREYNSKQKRNDRKIKNDDYLSKIKSSKNGEHVFYEDVLQWGTLEDFYKESNRELAKKALIKYMETFKERNPNLKLIGAYLHMDEVSPHLHFDYIPVATGYKTGLPVRNSLSKAMEQMGYTVDKGATRKNNQTMQWKEHEREYFASICKEVGLEVEPEKNWGRSNMSVAEYKEARNKMEKELAALGRREQEEQRQKIDKEMSEYKKAISTEIDATKAETEQQCEVKLADASRKAETIIAEANTTNEKSQQQLKWIASRGNTITAYEDANRSLMEFFKDQLKTVKKVLSKVAGLVVSSTTFFLDETKVSHCTYTISNTNPYPVIAESEKYDFSYSFNANENMVLPTDAKVAQDFVIACTTGDVTVSPVDLSPEISKKIKRHNIDIDLLS